MNEKSVSTDANGNREERHEKGLSLIVIGFLLWFFDALILFFMPAGVRLGDRRPFALLIVIRLRCWSRSHGLRLVFTPGAAA